MSEIHLDPLGRNGATGSELDPMRNFASINPLAQPGDSILVAAGSYSDGPAPTRDGTAEQPIIYAGLGDAIVNAAANLTGRSHVVLDALQLRSTGKSWLITSESSRDITLSNCALMSEDAGRGFPFVGVTLRGSHHTLLGCKFGQWLGGDAVQVWGDHCLLQDLDMSECDAGHGQMMLYGSHGVLRDITARNRWARFGEVVNKGDAYPCEGNVLERITITGSNWDGLTPVAGWQDSDGPGDGQVLKLGGVGTILRDFTARGCHAGDLKAQPYAAVIHIGNYGTSHVAKHIRMHNLTIEGNDLNALAITHDASRPFECEDVRLFNSILAGNRQALWLSQEGPWLDSLQIRNNVISDPIRRGNTTFAIGEYEAAYPEMASGNNETSIAAMLPLTFVTQMTEGDRLPVEDAYCLHEDDRMVVGNQPTQVIEWMHSNTVRVSPPVSVSVGDPVWRAKDYVPEPVEPPVEPPAEPEPIRASVTISVEVVGVGVTLSVNGKAVELE